MADTLVEPKEFYFNGMWYRWDPDYDFANTRPELKPLTSIGDLSKLIELGDPQALDVVDWLVSLKPKP